MLHQCIIVLLRCKRRGKVWMVQGERKLFFNKFADAEDMHYYKKNYWFACCQATNVGKSSSCSIFILINISISFYSPKIYYYVKQNVLCGGPFSVVFLFIFLNVAIDLNAQATLFHNSGLTKANLTTADATKYEYFEYSPDVDGLWLMYLSNFSSQVS